LLIKPLADEGPVLWVEPATPDVSPSWFNDPG
jgi:hypothetical protein